MKAFQSLMKQTWIHKLFQKTNFLTRCLKIFPFLLLLHVIGPPITQILNSLFAGFSLNEAPEHVCFVLKRQGLYLLKAPGIKLPYITPG